MLIVMFEVSAADSGAVMTALAPIMGRVVNFSMEAKADPMPPPRKPRRGGPRGSKVTRLVLAKLETGPAVPYDAIRGVLKAEGWSGNSASPVLSKLRKDGQVTFNSTDDTWSLVNQEK